MKSSRLNIDLSDTPYLAQQLWVLSARRRITQKAIVIEALRQYFLRDEENEFILLAADRSFAEWDNEGEAWETRT